jgi:hypothetical protein
VTEPDFKTLFNPYFRCDYLGSRGITGLYKLQSAVDDAAKRWGKEFTRRFPLHGACMNNCLDTTLSYVENLLTIAWIRLCRT